ncbi:hypothetical protein BDN70DRAFT_932957 [Pholiota conissans]|uniref:Uncharacterized protein n=1 Tax=Pholiota conissans TaxID=109636 RepID=A0A9P6CTX9_9AGAR|nr:hypothetical protein BDN70DRAFT_932957 [Pholiota conissans]
MVRFTISIAVIILAGTALARGVRYDEHFKNGRAITNNEKRDVFEALEERGPLFFSALKVGVLSQRSLLEDDEHIARDIEELEYPFQANVRKTMGRMSLRVS